MKDLFDELLSNVGDMALKRRARRVLEELQLKDGDKVLDLGCGDGYYSYLLTRIPLGLKIIGIDSHINAIDSAKSRVPKEKATFIVGYAEELPFPKNYFNKIIMSEIIEHVTDDTKVLKEARRVLRENGILVLTTPNKHYSFLWDPVNWTLEHFFNFHIKSGFFAGIWSQHLRLYKSEQLIKRMEKAGFEIVTCELLTTWCLPFSHYLLNLGCRLLFHKKLSKDISQDINKFSKSKKQKAYLSRFLFWLVNGLDRLNDVFTSSSGVSIFIKAIKK